jgi:hypothetical protein
LHHGPECQGGEYPVHPKIQFQNTHLHHKL